jgi:hypothetical protein
VKLRLHGTPAECELATHRLTQVFDVVAVSGPYFDQGHSVLVRVDLELRLDPVPPAALAGPGRSGRGLP